MSNRLSGYFNQFFCIICSSSVQKNVDDEKSDESLTVGEKPEVSKSDTDIASMVNIILFNRIIITFLNT